jgi:hypothetical protein
LANEGSFPVATTASMIKKSPVVRDYFPTVFRT